MNAKPTMYHKLRRFADYDFSAKAALFLVLLVLLILFFVGLMMVSWYYQAKREMSNPASRKYTIIAAPGSYDGYLPDGRSLQSMIDTTHADILFLSKAGSLQRYLKYSKNPQYSRSDSLFENFRQDVLETFHSLTRVHGHYLQVRFLDSSGQEIFRIQRQDGDIVTVAEDRLQNKSDRYYFKESIGLPEGSVYISPIDINREQGKIAKPHRFTIRHVSPVYMNHEIQGVVIINLNVRDGLNGFRMHRFRYAQIIPPVLNE